MNDADDDGRVISGTYEYTDLNNVKGNRFCNSILHLNVRSLQRKLVILNCC